MKASLIKKFSPFYRVRFYETRFTRHAEQLTELALSEGCVFLIAVGGDGTLNEMINGYHRFGGAIKSSVTLGVLPYGTGNDFARGLGISGNIDELLERMRRNEPTLLDAGLMEFQHPDGTASIRYFDNIADLGIGADVVSKVNGDHLIKRILGGKVNFFFAILFTFLTYKPKKIKVSWEGFSWEGTVLSLVVANGRYFGSGLGIAPEAKFDDGQFEVVIFAKLSIFDYLRNLSKLRKAKIINHPEVFYYRTNQVLVETGGDHVTVEADGELEGQAPVLYTCLPGAMRFIVP